MSAISHKRIDCDMCGERIPDKIFPVYDENLALEEGLKQCECCYRLHLGVGDDEKSDILIL